MNKTPYLSKSDFLKNLCCPNYLWLFKYKREAVPEDEEIAAKHRLRQGNEVEAWARKLFPDGVMIEAKFDKARKETEHWVEKGAKTIFQAAVFTKKGLLVKADVFKFDPKTKSWTLHEVKSSTKIKKERFHIEDVAFQKAAFEDAGYKIGKTYLVFLDKDYARRNGLDPSKLFMQEDVSDKVDKILPEIRAMAYDALELLKQSSEPKGCSCRLKSRSKHCPTFSYLNPDIPEYSVFDIARMQGKKLGLLIDDEIYNVDEVPDDIKLSTIQRNQVTAAKTKQSIVDRKAIAKMLKELVFPLHFLDYEAIGTALPLYGGTKPYQQIPFQYSLHVLRGADAKLEHHQFLDQVGKDLPIERLLKSLAAVAGANGSVIVWHKSFETGRNTEMAKMYPAYGDLLKSLNDRVFDLKDIFAKQHYVHHGFGGSNSIKTVLPVLVPEFSYKGLDIQGGDVAAIRWYDAITGAVNGAQAEKTFNALLEYCRLDTLAMVKIYQKLKSLG
ncbi:MAG: DUF2779 domain-containing protein [Patescibacteria group bacterium]